MHSAGDCSLFALDTALPKYRDAAHPLTPDQNSLAYNVASEVGKQASYATSYAPTLDCSTSSSSVSSASCVRHVSFVQATITVVQSVHGN